MFKIVFVLQLKPDRTTSSHALHGTTKTSKDILRFLYQRTGTAIRAAEKTIVKLITALLKLLDRRYVSGFKSTKNYNKETVQHMKSKPKAETENFAAINLLHDQTQDIQQSSSISLNEKQLPYKPTSITHWHTDERPVSILPLNNSGHDDANLKGSSKTPAPHHIPALKSKTSLNTPISKPFHRPTYNKSMSLLMHSNTTIPQADLVKKNFEQHQKPRDKPITKKQSLSSIPHTTETMLLGKEAEEFVESAQYTAIDQPQTALYTISTIPSATNTYRIDRPSPIGLIQTIHTLTTATEVLLQEYLGRLKNQDIKPGAAIQNILEKLNSQYAIDPLDAQFTQEMLLSTLLYSAAIYSPTSNKMVNFDISRLPDNWEKAVQSCCESETIRTLWNIAELSIFTTINHQIGNAKREKGIIKELIKKIYINTICNPPLSVMPSLPTTEALKKLTNDYLKLEDIVESYCTQLKTAALKPGKALQDMLDELEQASNMAKDEKFCSESLFLALLYTAISSTAATTNDNSPETKTLLNSFMCCMGRAGCKLDTNSATELLSKSVPYLAKCTFWSNQDHDVGSWNATEQSILSKTLNIAQTALMLIESNALLPYANTHEAMPEEVNTASNNAQTYASQQSRAHTESSTKGLADHNKADTYHGLIVFPKSVAKLLEEYQQNLETYEIQHGKAMEIILQYFGQNPLIKLSQDKRNSQFLLSSLMYAKSIVEPLQASESFGSTIPVWSKQEWQILSNIAYFLVCNDLPNNANDVPNNYSTNTTNPLNKNVQQLKTNATKQNSAAKPCANLIFITSPLLTDESPDYKYIVKQKISTIDTDRYYSAVEEKLLPALIIISEMAKKQGKKAWVCIPEINADYSAGKFSGSMRKIFYYALKALLERDSARLTAIEFVCLEPGMYQNEHKKCAEAYKELHQAPMGVPLKISMPHATEAEQLNLIVLPCTHTKCHKPNHPIEKGNQKSHITCNFDPLRHIPFTFVANAKPALPGTKELTTLTGHSCPDQDGLTKHLFVPAAHMFSSRDTAGLETMYLNLKCATNKQSTYPEKKPVTHPSTNLQNTETQAILPAQTQPTMAGL